MLAACRGTPEPAAAPAVEAPRWEGTAVDWIPPDAAAWVAIDVSRVRAIPELAALLPAEGSGIDGISRAVVRADELVFYWQGDLLTERVAVLRGPIDRVALLDALRSGSNFTGSSFELVTSGSQQLWKSRTGDWTVADPWPNLVLAGDLSAVLARLATAPAPGPQADSAALLLRARWNLAPIHRRWLAQNATLGAIAPLLEPVQRIELVLIDEADPRFVLRLPLDENADPTLLIALINAALTELLAPPDDGRARAQPGIATRSEGEGAHRAVVAEVVMPRGQLVALAATLADDAARIPSATPRIGDEGSGAPAAPAEVNP